MHTSTRSMCAFESSDIDITTTTFTNATMNSELGILVLYSAERGSEGKPARELDKCSENWRASRDEGDEPSLFVIIYFTVVVVVYVLFANHRQIGEPLSPTTEFSLRMSVYMCVHFGLEFSLSLFCSLPAFYFDRATRL